MENIEKLNYRPFTRFCMSIGAVPSSYLAGLTIEEQLLWLCSYLEKEVIPAVNNNAEAVEELQNLFTELQTYVNNYFDNLDVQEEINNKLDVMAEDGTLDQIINQEIFGEIQQDISDLGNRIDNEVGDLENLTTLNNQDIVGAINSNNQLQQIYLGNGMFYDIPQDVGHVQGSCIHENNLYVAVQGTSPTGYIYVFNISSNTYVTRYENVTMYHGNDMTYINDKIYIASVDNLSLCVYDLSTNTSTVLTPFSSLSGYSELTGVEKIDDTHLMCWFKNTNGTNTIANDKFVSLDLTTYDYTDFVINDSNNILNFAEGVTRQNIALDGNTLYVLMVVPTIIYEANIIGNNINFNKIYNLPPKDINNNPISEPESLAIINNDIYPKGSLMLTTRSFETFKNLTQIYTEDTICNYIFSPKAGNVDYADLTDGYPARGTNNFGYISVSKSVGNLIEVGSASRPFKNLMRAINCVVKGKYNPQVLQIIDSSEYFLPYLYGITNIQITANNGCNPTIYIGDIENCDISFSTEGNGTITFKPIATNKRSTISFSRIRFYANSSNSCIFNNIQMVENKGSIIHARRCKFENTETVSSGYAWQIFDASQFIDNFDTFSLAGTDKPFMVASGSIIFTDKSVVKNGTSGVFVLSS